MVSGASKRVCAPLSSSACTPTTRPSASRSPVALTPSSTSTPRSRALSISIWSNWLRTTCQVRALSWSECWKK